MATCLIYENHVFKSYFEELKVFVFASLKAVLSKHHMSEGSPEGFQRESIFATAMVLNKRGVVKNRK